MCNINSERYLLQKQFNYIGKLTFWSQMSHICGSISETFLTNVNVVIAAAAAADYYYFCLSVFTGMKILVVLWTSQENWTLTFYLHDAVYLLLRHLSLYDAVYLYLRTVNQTLAEDQDYRDGRLMLKNTIGQRFTGRFQRPFLS